MPRASCTRTPCTVDTVGHLPAHQLRQVVSTSYDDAGRGVDHRLGGDDEVFGAGPGEEVLEALRQKNKGKERSLLATLNL